MVRVREIKFKGVLVGFLILLMGLAASGNVFARTGGCRTSNIEEINDSIAFACTHAGTQGVMWISSNSATNSIESVVRVDDWVRGKVDAYLHGAVLDGSDALASHIKIVQGSHQIVGTAAGYSEYSPPLEGVPSTMNRHGNSKSTASVISSVVTIKLNVRWIVDNVNRYTVKTEWEDGELKTYHVYTIPIQAFRCYGTNVPSPTNGSCFSSSSMLKVEVRVLTLSGIARDVNGELLGNDPDPKTGIAPGETGVIKRKVISGYKFLGWSEKPKGDAEQTGIRYEVNNMRRNRTVYAVYEKQEIQSECEVISTPASYLNSNEQSGISSTESRVQNNTLDTEWQTTVWAKPGDEISWYHCYFPGAQRPYKTTVTLDPIPDSHPTSSATTTISSTNGEFQSRSGYINQYTVESSFGYGAGLQKLTVGDDKIRKNQNDSVITINNPGSQLTETMKGWIKDTNVGSPAEHAWGCNWTSNNCSACGCDTPETDEEGNATGGCAVCGSCYRDTCRHSNVYISSSINAGPASSTAWVNVPYNYANRTELEQIDKNTKFFFAGERIDINHTIYTDPKTNALTSPDGKYATIVREAKTKARLCVGATCYETNAKATRTPQEGVLNPNGDMNGAEVKETIELNVPDLPAGTEICYSTSVFPANSGADSNYTDVRGSNTWSEWSQPICVRVAKKPNIEVLGGNVFVNGGIQAGLSVKNLLYGAYDEGRGNVIDPSSASNGRPYVFGSWGELGVIANGEIRNFASGNGLGYNKAVAGTDAAGMTLPNRRWNADVNNYSGNYNDGRPGGANTSTICPNLSTLTISNECKNSSAAGLNNKVDQLNVDLDSLEQLADSYKNQNNEAKKQELTGDIDLRGDTVNYYYANGDATVRGSNYLVRDSYIIVKVAGVATIASDIAASEDDSFETIGQVPKMIVFAKNIKINCDVARIDAVLVAEERVVTCAPEDGTDFNGVNNKKNPYDDNKNLPVFSRQLVVNGAIIAKGLDATRTYGAARGQNSMVSAEVINFDPTLYLWGGIRGEKANSRNSLNGDLEVTYMKELAPRV